jgi:hypothetical protein
MGEPPEPAASVATIVMTRRGDAQARGKYTISHFEHNLAAAIARGIGLTQG